MWPNLQFPADLVPFNEEILNGKLYFFCSDLNLYLQVSSNFLYLVSIALDIRLNTLRFMILTTSEIQIFVNGWMILLQLPLDLLILTL